MPKAFATWTVLPHGPLEAVSPRIRTVTGELAMPLTRLERRMTVVRLCDGRLVVYSAIALQEPQMQELESFGRPAFLIVPSHLHRLDAPAWKRRYPELCVVAPSGARQQVAQVVPVDTTEPSFGDPTVRFVELAGTANREAALEVDDSDGVTLILNDVVGNLPQSHGWVLRALGFATARPRVPRMAKLALVKDAKSLRASFERWSGEPIRRLIVSHGAPVLSDAPQVLSALARSL